jgi:O-antigen ligase
MIDLKERLGRSIQLVRRMPADQLRQCLFWLFALSVLLFPLGQALRVLMPLACLPALLLLYARDWPGSALARLPVRWLFVVFFASMALQLVFAIDVKNSFSVVWPNVFRAFILPFIGMECVRSEKDLRRLVVVFALTAMYEGLDGVWQYATGRDLIARAAWVAGRLTGSLGGYRVGDYMGIMLLPSFALFLLAPGKTLWLRFSAALIVLAPALFLWLFAQARMGYLAVAIGGYALWTLIFDHTHWKALLLPPVAALLLVLFGPSRISVAAALSDGRFALWKGAWDVFAYNPWLGTGIGSYEGALHTAGLTVDHVPGFMHPHNAYLQFLVDGGILGFACMTLFLFGCALWAFARIRKGVQWERARGSGMHWRLAGFFWAAWVGYLVVAAGGHDFSRGWFLATGMTVLGIMLGAVLHGPQSDRTSHQERIT